MTEKTTDPSRLSRRTLLRITAAAGVAPAAISEVGAGAPQGDGERAEWLVIGLDDDLPELAQAAQDHLPEEATVEHENETLGYVAASLPSSADREAVKRRLERAPNVRYAEDNVQSRALFTPDDPGFSQQYAPQMVNAVEAWEKTTGSSDVTIAVLDTGVTYDHPDLAPNVDDSMPNHGYDFVSIVDQMVGGEEDETRDGDPYPTDLDGTDGDGNVEGHGTHVAGILGAATDNATGVAGISDCTILCGRVLDEDGIGYHTDQADALQWAVDNGADIVNMSLGSGTSSQVLQDGVTYADSNGALVIAAAGNDGQETDQYPASYPEVLAVSSLDSDGSLSSYSNYGDHVDLAAPGRSVLAPYPVNGDGNAEHTYAYLSGTSMATPVVAGVAGLALSRLGWLTNDELRTHLKDTAKDMGLPANKQGSGMVLADGGVSVPDHEHVGETWSGDPGDRGVAIDVGSSTDVAVYGASPSTGARALKGVATATSGRTIGVEGKASSPDSVALLGNATATGGTAKGLEGRSEAKFGTGVIGNAKHPSGATKGVRGIAGSPNGRGIEATNTASSGTAYGIDGRTDSPSGVAIRGHATSASGTTYAVRGEVASGDGYGLSTPDDAEVGGTQTVGGGTVHQQRGDPTTDELAAGEVMTFNSDGSGTGSAGDLVYAINDGGAIKTQVVASRGDAT